MALCAKLWEVWLDEVDLGLVLDIPNGDTLVCGGADPSAGWRSSDGIDNLWGCEGDDLLACLDVPHADLVIRATGHEPLAVWCEGD